MWRSLGRVLFGIHQLQRTICSVTPVAVLRHNVAFNRFERMTLVRFASEGNLQRHNLVKDLSEQEFNKYVVDRMNGPDPARIIRVLRNRNEACSSLSSTSYGIMMAACRRAHDYNLGIELFKELEAKDLPRDGNLYANAMDCFAHTQRMDEAIALLREAEQKGILLPPRAYRYLIQGYAHANQFDKAQELFDQMRQDSRLNKDCAIYCGMMAAYSVAGQLDKARELVESLPALGVVMDAEAHNTLLRAFLAAKQYEAAEKYVTTVLAGPNYNEMTFCMAIEVCKILKKPTKATSLFELMSRLKLEPSHATIGHMLSAYIESGQTVRALSLFNHLIENRKPLALYHYTAIINAAAREDRLGRAQQIKQLMQRRGMAVPQRSFDALVECCCRLRAIPNALSLLYEMRAGEKHTQLALGRICEAMLALNRNKEAEELLMSEPRTPTSLAFYVKGLARQGNHAAALDMFEKIKQLQKEGGSFFQHDAQMALVTALWLMGHRDEALSILETALKDASRFSAIRELLEGSIDLAGHTGSLNILWPIITRFGEQDPFSYNPRQLFYVRVIPERVLSGPQILVKLVQHLDWIAHHRAKGDLPDSDVRQLLLSVGPSADEALPANEHIIRSVLHALRPAIPTEAFSRQGPRLIVLSADTLRELTAPLDTWKRRRDTLLGVQL